MTQPSIRTIELAMRLASRSSDFYLRRAISLYNHDDAAPTVIGELEDRH